MTFKLNLSGKNSKLKTSKIDPDFENLHKKCITDIIKRTSLHERVESSLYILPAPKAFL